MKKVLLINNHGKSVERLIFSVKKFGFEVDVVEPLKKFDERAYRAMILSGGYIKREIQSKALDWYKNLFYNSSLPILGICLGHKLMGYCYGAKILSMGNPRIGYYKIQFSYTYDLLPDVKGLYVYQNHKYKLASLPNFLKNYASSNECEIEALKHINKKQYSVQFHPEVNDYDKRSLKIVENFLKMC